MNKKKRSAKMRLKSGAVSGVLTLSLTLSAIAPNAASAIQRSTNTTDAQSVNSQYLNLETGKIEYTLPGIVSRYLWQLPQRTVSVNGVKLSEPAVVMNDTLYLPLRAFANALGNATVNYNKSTRTATLSMSGLYLTATDGGFVTYANDRPLFSFSPNVLMSNGRMYIPASALTKATGVRIESQDSGSVSIKGTYKALTPASKYYREDEVYWLSKIISAESQGESLIGQIAVGDVIMNRVKSSLYPNTIYSVIFDRNYGVQFSPILNGTIYNTPSYNSVLAAKICLEGATFADEVMFFLQPELSASSWIPRTREYCFTVGRHDFYK